MQIARGSMGEYSAFGETMLGECAFTAEKSCLSAIGYSGVLYSFNAEKFIYVHTRPFGYDKCKVNSTLKATLMIADIRGEQ